MLILRGLVPVFPEASAHAFFPARTSKQALFPFGRGERHRRFLLFHADHLGCMIPKNRENIQKCEEMIIEYDRIAGPSLANFRLICYDKQ